MRTFQREPCVLLLFLDHIVYAHFYATVQFCVKSARTLIIYCADRISQSIKREAVTADVLEYSTVFEPLYNGARTVIGQRLVALKSYILGILAYVVVLTCGQSFGRDKLYTSVLEYVFSSATVVVSANPEIYPPSPSTAA